MGTFAPPMLTTPRSPVLSMLKDTGESSSSTSLRDTDMVTTTTPRPLVLRPVSSQTLLVVFLPLATHTEGSSSTLTGSLALALATSLLNLIQTKNQNQENHGLSQSILSVFIIYFLFIFISMSSSASPHRNQSLNGTANNISFLSGAG